MAHTPEFSPHSMSQPAIDALYVERTANATNIETYQLPVLPEAAAYEIYERLLDAERRIAAPHLLSAEYDDGTALEDDELLIEFGSDDSIVTTEHATSQRRSYASGMRRKGPEYGLAALGSLLHEDAQATHLTMTGRQLGDANNDPQHKLKDALKTTLNNDGVAQQFYSLHGMKAGLVGDLSDPTSFDVAIGIGSNPTEATVTKADAIKSLAADLGLRAGINQPFVTLESRAPYVQRRHPDGSLKTITFGAEGNTTRQFAETYGSKNLAALQIELSGLLRLLPSDKERDPKSRVMGAYMGYLLLKNAFGANQ